MVKTRRKFKRLSHAEKTAPTWIPTKRHKNSTTTSYGMRAYREKKLKRKREKDEDNME